MLGRHAEELTAARHAVESLAAQVADLSSQLHALRHDQCPPQSARFPSELRVNNPSSYVGEPTQRCAFLTQFEVVFSLQPFTYAEERSRIAYILSLQSGRERVLGTAVWEAESEICTHYDAFKEEMLKVFDRSVHGREASDLVAALCQGHRPVTDYAIEFRTLYTTCGRNYLLSLSARFLDRLTADLKDELYSYKILTGLDPLIELSIRMEKHLALHQRSNHPAAGFRHRGELHR